MHNTTRIFYYSSGRVVEVGTTNDECVSCFGSARLFRVRIFLLFKMCVCLIGLQDPVPLASSRCLFVC